MYNIKNYNNMTYIMKKFRKNRKNEFKAKHAKKKYKKNNGK